ncbi:MAG: hypothetical protein JWL64_1542 [Frankiales bacterium]|nr:hypothetical protein [Frankiales bacterium]
MTGVAIVGTGFGGPAAAVRLEQAGTEDLELFQRGTDAAGPGGKDVRP